MDNIFFVSLVIMVFLFNACTGGDNETLKNEYLRIEKEIGQCTGKGISEDSKRVINAVITNCNENELRVVVEFSNCHLKACKEGVRNQNELNQKCHLNIDEKKIKNTFSEKCSKASLDRILKGKGVLEH